MKDYKTTGSRHLYAGKVAEAAAANFLRQKGYKILCQNFRTRYGELDIIAQDKSCIVFVEVRSGTKEDASIPPRESISKYKRRKLTFMALEYLQKRHHYKNASTSSARFDVVEVILEPAGRYALNIELIPNAFIPETPLGV